MKEREEIEINELDKNNIQELETKEILVKKLTDSKIDIPAFKEFMTDLADLNTVTDVYMIPKEDGWKDIDFDDKKILNEKYMKLANSIEKFIKDSEASEDDATKAACEIAKKLSEFISQEHFAIQYYSPKNKKQILPEILNEARTQTIDVANKSLEAVGGAQSARIPMKIVSDDGGIISGYFTKASYFKPVEDFKNMLEEAAKYVENPQGKAMLKGFYEKYISYYQAHPDNDHPMKDHRRIIRNMGFDFLKNRENVKDTTMSSTKIINEFAKIYGKTPKDIKTICGSKPFTTINKYFQKNIVTISAHNLAGAMNKSRIDSNNTAMSIIAGLLGIQQTICHARPMKIRAKDGSEIEGTFMEESTFSDTNNPGFAASKIGKDSLKGTVGKGLKDLADLQVLDFICGNVDRHPGNIFIKIDDDGKIVGVQGIDNDCCMGGIIEAKNNVKEMVSPENMLVISKKTADKILQLTPDQIAFALRGRVLKSSITAVRYRINALKEKILASREANKKKDYIAKGHLTELEDKDWKNVNVDKLTKLGEKNSNIFKKLSDDLVKIHNRSNMPKKDKLEDIADIFENENRATAGGVENQVVRSKALIKLLNDNYTRIRGTSDNYTNMQTALNDYKNKTSAIIKRIVNSRKLVEKGDISPEAIYGKYVNRNDMIDMTNSIKVVYEMSKKYYDDKNADLKAQNKKPNKYEKGRINAAKEVMDFAKRLLKASPEEEKTLQENTRLATDKMVKSTKNVNEKNIIKAPKNSNNKRTNKSGLKKN